MQVIWKSCHLLLSRWWAFGRNRLYDCKLNQSNQYTFMKIYSSNLLETVWHTVNAVIFVWLNFRVWQHKNISRVVKFALSRCSLVILVLQIFLRVFEFALAEFARNTRKLMYHEYFHFYSSVTLCLSIVIFSQIVKSLQLVGKNMIHWKFETKIKSCYFQKWSIIS